MEKARIRDYRDLIAWQKAMDLAVMTEKVCAQLPGRASHLATQMRRAAASIPANIAEGNGRFSRLEYIRHLSIANGSVRELETHLELAARNYGRTENVLVALGLRWRFANFSPGSFALYKERAGRLLPSTFPFPPLLLPYSLIPNPCR